MSADAIPYSANPLANLGNRFGHESDTFLYFSAKTFGDYLEEMKKGIIDTIASEHIGTDEIRKYGEFFSDAVFAEAAEAEEMYGRKILTRKVQPDNEDAFYFIISGPDCELKKTLIEEYENAIRTQYLLWTKENLAGFDEETTDRIWERYNMSF